MPGRSTPTNSATKPLDLVVTVCDSAAADCPTWPGARHLVHWSIEDPSFVHGDEETRLAAFRATRDELRDRIDSLMEALRRSHPKRKDAELVEAGSLLLEDVLQAHGFKREAIREEGAGGREAAKARFARRGRAFEVHVRTGVAIAALRGRIEGACSMPTTCSGSASRP